MARPYEQHCALAHALDLVGERWTLLIVRELLAGPRRYGDLATGLVNVPSNVLAARLKQLEDDGIVRRRPLDPPAHAVTVYELTELGKSLSASLTELARWGMQTLPAEREDRSFQSHWLIPALNARFDSKAAKGVTETYEFRIEGDDVLHFEVDDGAGTPRVGSSESEPAVVVATDADTFIELTAGAITAADAIERGARIEGKPKAVARLRAILPPATEGAPA